MSKCMLNGKDYEISKNIILNRINAYSTNFTDKEKDNIVNEVVFRMEGLEVEGRDCQEFNFIEERYTDACLDYIFNHDNKVEALLNESDDCEIWDCLE